SPVLMEANCLHQKLACLESLETGGYMCFGIFPAWWTTSGKGQSLYPLGQPFGVFPINRLRVGYRFLRKSQGFLGAPSLKCYFGLEGGKHILEEKSFLTEDPGKSFLLHHMCNSLLMMAQANLNPCSYAVAYVH